ncbi:O-antigen ligase family protein [Cytobacillus sp. IB215316]|uniref:O-antigen ligase family protein n=1 Tax=Cytobacillus sp. IB215316 TaxID=3097354 RepID=UPI002A121999|nr:O-antigen ligase family protein [Cytobacillus sp. IB215316]MDX8361175.1 O-antigen ligase family protein [Cytobacillus sp. IB215316]
MENIKSYRFLLIGFLILTLSLTLTPKLALISITAIFAVYTIVNPKNALLLLLLYVPIRPLYAEANPGLKYIGDIITILLFLITVYQLRHDIRSIFRFKIFEWAFFLFCLVGAVSAYMTGVSIVAIVFQLRTFLIMYLLYYIISRMKIDKQDITKFAWVTVFVAMLISLHGIIEKLSLRTWLLPQAWVERIISETNFARIYGMPGNPNTLGMYLGVAIVLSLYLLHQAEGQTKRFLYVALTLFNGTMLLTLSRGTLISVFIGWIVFLALTRYWKPVKPYVVTLILGILLVYFPTNGGVALVQYINDQDYGKGGFINRIQHTVDDETQILTAETGRIYFIEKGFEVFKDYPMMGSGFATFGDSATLSFSSPIYEKYNIYSDGYGEGSENKYYFQNFYTDNQYIQVIAETGAAGVILFALFLLGMLVLFWKRRKEDLFSNVMIAFWMATCASGLLYNIWETKIYTLYFFMILGAYAAKHKLVLQD